MPPAGAAQGPPWALVAVFGVGGLLHFVVPHVYERIMPPWLPAHRALVLASGAAELLGAVGLLFPAWRVAAGWWLVLVLAAVFPANVYMLTEALGRPTSATARALLWARLPLQPLLMWWVWLSAIRRG
jgi:uncharacterized membrane protein